MNPITTATRESFRFVNYQVIMAAEPTIKYNASFEGALINLSTA